MSKKNHYSFSINGENISDSRHKKLRSCHRMHYDVTIFYFSSQMHSGAWCIWLLLATEDGRRLLQSGRHDNHVAVTMTTGEITGAGRAVPRWSRMSRSAHDPIKYICSIFTWFIYIAVKTLHCFFCAQKGRKHFLSVNSTYIDKTRV